MSECGPIRVQEINEYGDGVGWVRGSVIGKGGFGCVYLATVKNPKFLPPLMAVKSAEVSASGTIQKEREVLSNLRGCPYVIRCFGEETTVGNNGIVVYNLLLEYGSGGTLASRIAAAGGGGLPELEARAYARSILRGLMHIHGNGYVHCDLKPENVFLLESDDKFRAKIGDFGLAVKKRRLEPYWQGTPAYLSPEAVVDRIQDAGCDIWALGCVVLEMLTGKPPWGGNAEEVLWRIREGNALPEIPVGLSPEAREFLKACLVRNPAYRWSCEMLLCCRFVEGLDEDDWVEKAEEINNLDVLESMVVENECGCGLFEDDDDDDDDDLVSYWSEEDVDSVYSGFLEVL